MYNTIYHSIVLIIVYLIVKYYSNKSNDIESINLSENIFQLIDYNGNERIDSYELLPVIVYIIFAWEIVQNVRFANDYLIHIILINVLYIASKRFYDKTTIEYFSNPVSNFFLVLLFLGSAHLYQFKWMLGFYIILELMTFQTIRAKQYSINQIVLSMIITFAVFYSHFYI